MTFYEWLKKQEGKNTLAGAMADDMANYKDSYIVKDLDRIGWIKYFIDEDSCRTVIKALDVIWDEFDKDQSENTRIKKLEEEILSCDKKLEEEVVPEKLEEEPLENDMSYDENAVKGMFDIVKEDEENPTVPPLPPAKRIINEDNIKPTPPKIRKIKEGEQPPKPNIEPIQKKQKQLSNIEFIKCMLGKMLIGIKR